MVEVSVKKDVMLSTESNFDILDNALKDVLVFKTGTMAFILGEPNLEPFFRVIGSGILKFASESTFFQVPLISLLSKVLCLLSNDLLLFANLFY